MKRSPNGRDDTSGWKVDGKSPTHLSPRAAPDFGASGFLRHSEEETEAVEQDNPGRQRRPSGTSEPHADPGSPPRPKRKNATEKDDVEEKGTSVAGTRLSPPSDGRKTLSRLEWRRLTELRHFPAQEQFFDPLSRFDLEELAQDIRKNGLQCPIEILPVNGAGLPPNTIVSGHQRLRALEQNGETEARVRVRYDLAGADRGEIESEFLQANQFRRHLDPLAKARVALRLFELGERTPSGRVGKRGEGEQRDAVGKAIGMSGRNLDRYLRVLRTPIEVQNAVRSGKLSLHLAGKVASLPETVQKQMAAELESAENPSRVIRQYLPTNKSPKTTIAAALASLVRTLDRAGEELAHRLDELTPRSVGRHLEAIQKGLNLLRSIESIGVESAG